MTIAIPKGIHRPQQSRTASESQAGDCSQRSEEMRGNNESKRKRNRFALELSPALHRFEHRHLVGVLQVRANRNAHADARHAHPQRLQQF
jgi:hypothetical protein